MLHFTAAGVSHSAENVDFSSNVEFGQSLLAEQRINNLAVPDVWSWRVARSEALRRACLPSPHALRKASERATWDVPPLRPIRPMRLIRAQQLSSSASCAR